VSCECDAMTPVCVSCRN